MTDVIEKAPVKDGAGTASVQPQPSTLFPDLMGFLFFAAVTAIFFLNTELVVSLTKQHPYLMAFIKFSFLASFGECLKNRISSRRWVPTKLPVRFVVWGVFGMWMGTSFPYTVGGLDILIKQQMWIDTPLPFWQSFWICLLSGYAFFMMYCHYWVDSIVAEGFLWPWQVLGRPQTERWAKIVWISLVCFWVPAHTMTFSLPPHWRVLSAAYLAIALGLILSFASRRK